MSLRKLYSLVLLACISSLSLIAQNGVPVISNIQLTFNGSILTVHYDLEDPENDVVGISFRVSVDNGETFSINTRNATGDIGFPISPGVGKQIDWDYSLVINSSGNYQVMIVADDRQAIDIQAIVDQVDSNRIRSDLEFIEGIRHRTAGPDHLAAVQNLIKDRFNDNGLRTEIQSFGYQGYQAENIVGRKTGLTQETNVFILDGHYDTVDDSPGADDNGSAIAGMLEALRVLSPYEFTKSIKFIGFDLEEEGLVGSGRYVNNGGIKGYEEIEGVFNFEMIGYYDSAPGTQELPNGFNFLFPEAYQQVQDNDFRGDFITNVGFINHPEFTFAYDSAATRYVPDLKVISILAPSNWFLVTPDLGRSDHAHFWRKDIPAVMLTDGSNFRNPYYHSPADTVGTLNFTFMSNVVKAAVGAIAEMAGITHSSYEVAEIELVTGVEGKVSPNYSIYPNPADDRIVIELDGQADVELMDQTGRILAQKEINNTGTLKLGKLSPAVYLLKISFDTGESIVERVVRQ